MRVTRRQLRVIGSVDFFHEHGAIRKLACLAVILSRSGRGVGNVHLVPLRIEHCICSKRLVIIPKISRLANIPCLVHQLKAVEATGALGTDWSIAAQGDEREDERENYE